MSVAFWNRKIMTIKVKEYAFVAGFYFFFAFSYYTTLWLNRQGYTDPNDPLLSLSNFRYVALDYLLKLILTIPIWWVVFRKFNRWNLWQRFLTHLFFLPVFTLCWQQIFYAISDYFGYGHLQGSGQVWDIYIPGLFYILQFGIFHAYEYYVDNQAKLKLEADLRESVLKSELATLKAQLNPHFLYNVFNTISASVPPEQEQTREMIANLSDLFRYQLKASQSEFVPLKEEVTFIKQYLLLEKARFENRLKITIDIDDDLLERSVPPMLLQPLVENAVKHGISTAIEGGEVKISVRESGGKLYFEIVDTGIGVEDLTDLVDKGVGITNTKLRLEKMFNSTLQFTQNHPRGLRVAFSI